MSATQPQLKGIGQILVPISDLDRAIAFYEGVLGLPVLMRFPGIAFLDAGNTRLYLATVPQADFQGRATVYFWTDDVTGTLAALRERGAPVREQPSVVFRSGDYDFWLAFVTDPDGNQIGLIREAPPGTIAG